MTDLPPGWVWVDVRDLAAPRPGSLTDGPFGSNLKTEHYVSERGPRVIRLQNIGDLEFKGQDEAFITQDHFGGLTKHAVEPGDLLIAGLGEVLPRVCVAPADIGQAIVKADCFRLRCATGIDPKFVQFMLSAPRVRQAAATLIGGVGRPRLSLRKLGALTIPLAPPAEQGRIVRAVEEEFSRLEAGAAALASVNKGLTRMRAAALDRLLQDPDGRNWPGVALGEVVASGRYGTSTKCAVDGAGLPVLRIPNVQSGSVSLADLKYAVNPQVDLSGAIANRDDILVIRTNGSRSLIGRPAVVPELPKPMAFASYLIRLRVDSSVANPAYVAAALEAPRIRRRIEEMAATSAGQYNISLGKLRALEIPLPSRAEQSETLIELQNSLALQQRVATDLGQTVRRAQRLRAAILDLAFRGRLVPQLSSEEPASVFLERLAKAGERLKRSRRPRRSAPRETAA